MSVSGMKKFPDSHCPNGHKFLVLNLHEDFLWCLNQGQAWSWKYKYTFYKVLQLSQKHNNKAVLGQTQYKGLPPTHTIHKKPTPQ